MTFKVRPLSDFHKTLLFNSVEKFQKTKSHIEAITTAYVAIGFGLESLDDIQLERIPNSELLTLESLQTVLRLDPVFTKEILEAVWLASFGTPTNLSLVPKSESSH